MNAWALLAPSVTVLGWCLVQFVWQAALVGVAYALVRAVVPRGNPRYLAAMLALVALAACPVVTVWRLLTASAAPVVLGDMLVGAGDAPRAVAQVAAVGGWRAAIAVVLPWIVLAWMLGVGVLVVRVVRQWRGLRAMLQRAQALPAWQARARGFAARLGLRRLVPVLASVRVATPTLVGWLRPAVVLPVAVLAQLPPAQIDLILAHELAHLRRCDHLANLFQVVLETLFFYHPVVHWISRDARNERELCCDELALRVTGGERRDFVAALASLEELRTAKVELALAASGGVLVERAWFIAGGALPRRRHRVLRGHAVAVVAAVALVGLGGSWWQHATAQRQALAAAVAANAAMFLQRVPLQIATQHLAGVVDIAPAASHPLPLAVAEPAVPRSGLTSREPVALVLDVAPLRVAPLAPVRVMQPLPTAGMAPATVLPRAVHTARPVYPPAALLAGAEARVVVEFALDAQGVPHELSVVGAGTSALAEAFDGAALRALQRWRFAPPAVPGRHYRQTFTFEIGAAPAADAPATARACLVGTGTHICRRVLGGGIETLPAH